MASGISPEDIASQPLRFAELHSGQTLMVERNIRRKVGRRVTLELNARLLSCGRLLFLARGISVRQRMEQEARTAEATLKESERPFRSLFDLSPAALVFSRPSDGRIQIANPAALAMLQQGRPPGTATLEALDGKH